MRLAPLLALLLLPLGCTSTLPAEGARPFRFAVVPAPAVGSAGGLERLYAALELLSTRTDALDLCLVPGPLFGGEDEGLVEDLAHALGSFPAPVVVAPAPGDVARQAALLQALEEAFQPQARNRGPRKGWEAIALGADGRPLAAPEDAGSRRFLVAAAGVTPVEPPEVTLLVEVVGVGGQLDEGSDARLRRDGSGQARLGLAPLDQAPHQVALGTIVDGAVRVSLVPLEPGPEAAPAPPRTSLELGPLPLR